MKAYRGVEVQPHSFLTQALGRLTGQNRPPAVLPPGKESRYQLNMRMCGPQSCSVRFLNKKKVLPLPRQELRTVQTLATGYTNYAVLSERIESSKEQDIGCPSVEDFLKKFQSHISEITFKNPLSSLCRNKSRLKKCFNASQVRDKNMTSLFIYVVKSLTEN